MSTTEPTVVDSTRAGRAAGLLLIVTAILEAVARSHHPLVHGNDMTRIVAQIERMATLTGLVHGTLMALMLVGFYCLTQHCLQRGLCRPLVRAGLIAYAVGTLAMLGAAMISGFLIVEVASHLWHDTPASQATSKQVMMLCHAGNQVFARVGVVALSAGILAWSIDLLRSDGLAVKVGVIGCAVGVIPPLAFLLGVRGMEVFNMSVVVVLQACWSIGMGVLVYRSACTGT